MQLTQQQMGQAFSCAEVVLEGRNARMCDDPTFFDDICCSSCRLFHEALREERNQQWQALSGPIDRARGLLQACNEEFRSPPLHGSGGRMPLLALGTAGLSGFQGAEAIDMALRVGFRHLDSALMYENHDAVSNGLARSGVPREDVFITSKVPPNMMGFKAASEAVAKFRTELPGGYADLCLMHWPHSSRGGGTEGQAPRDRGPEWHVVERAGTWRALEEAFEEGVCRAIGVSNFMVKHLEELRRYANVPPSVNQLEFAPTAPLADVARYCRQHGIVLEAYGWRRPEVLGHAAARSAAEQLGRPAAEVVTLWFLQRGHVPLYKTGRLDRLLEHVEALAGPRLSEAQLAELSAASAAGAAYPWRYYTGKWEPAPWDTLVMAEVAGETSRGGRCTV